MLSQKIALITGASSGIGAATAKNFVKRGSSVILSGRKVDNLESVASECRKLTTSDIQEVTCIPAELTDEKAIAQLAEKSIAWKGSLDILVNNAGILERGTIESTSLDQYDRMMSTNVRSIYQLTMLCVPALLRAKGNVVNVSSVNGIRSFPGVLAYNMSKAAVDQFTRCVALELAAQGVRVNSVNPGVTVTELHKRGTGLDDKAYAKFLRHSQNTHAMGRVGMAEEAAETIAFLASDSASFITGASIPVDGGRHAMCPR